MPCATTSSVPTLELPKTKSQRSDGTLIGMMRTLYATPAVPTLLLVACAMVPATCVPCPTKSSGVPSFQMKSRGEANAAAGPRSVAREKGTETWPSDGKVTTLTPLKVDHARGGYETVAARCATPVSMTATMEG